MKLNEKNLKIDVELKLEIICQKIEENELIEEDKRGAYINLI